jgi:hypothetical protein
VNNIIEFLPGNWMYWNFLFLLRRVLIVEVIVSFFFMQDINCRLFANSCELKN